MTYRRDPRYQDRRPGEPRDDPEGPRRGRSLPVAATLSALGLVLVAVATVSLLSGDIPIIGRTGGGNGGPIKTPTPSNVVVVDPRASVLGELVFVKDGNVWLQRGAVATQLTTGGQDETPSFSPDGQWVYFVRVADQDGRWRASGIIRTYNLAVPSIMKVKADGSGEPQQVYSGLIQSGSLTWHMFIRQPRLSPDGTLIAMMTDGPDPTVSDVVLKFLVVATGRIQNPKLAEIPPNGHQDPAWSPDGTSLLYVKEAREGSRGTPVVMKYTLATRKAVAVTGPGYMQPSWSPDGRYIVATQTTATGTDVAILDPRTGSEVLRVTSDGRSFAPAWSPAGDAVAFLRVNGGVVDLFLARLTGPSGNWSVADTLQMTVSAGLDAASGIDWYIAPSELPTPAPTVAPTPAGTPAAVPS